MGSNFRCCGLNISIIFQAFDVLVQDVRIGIACSGYGCQVLVRGCWPLAWTTYSITFAAMRWPSSYSPPRGCQGKFVVPLLQVVFDRLGCSDSRGMEANGLLRFRLKRLVYDKKLNFCRVELLGGCMLHDDQHLYNQYREQGVDLDIQMPYSWAFRISG